MHKIELSKIMADRYSDSDDPDNAPRTMPVLVNIDAIRCVTPRRDGRVGSRLTFRDGGGFACVETYDEVKGLIDGFRGF